MYLPRATFDSLTWEVAGMEAAAIVRNDTKTARQNVFMLQFTAGSEVAPTTLTNPMVQIVLRWYSLGRLGLSPRGLEMDNSVAALNHLPDAETLALAEGGRTNPSAFIRADS